MARRLLTTCSHVPGGTAQLSAAATPLIFSLPPPAAPALPAGEFHSQQCVPWRAWEEGEPLARRGGMWNEAAAPFVPRLADAHLKTWDPSVRFWATHMPAECTHWWAGDSGRGRPRA